MLEMVEGHLRIKDRAKDYIDRGNELENWSFLDFFLGTYDGAPMKKKDSTRGRKPNMRVPYRDGCGRDTRCRIIKSPGHETMPFFPGQWFPKQDLEDENGLFEASMLALLKPWRSLSDLKETEQSFRSAYDVFFQNASSEVRRTVKNIQFFHECGEHARRRDQNLEAVDEPGQSTAWSDVQVLADGPPARDEESTTDFDDFVTEDDIQRVLDQPHSPRELIFADAAVDIGLKTGALQVITNDTVYDTPAPVATRQDLACFEGWQAVLDRAREEEEIAEDSSDEVVPLSTVIGNELIDPEPSASQLAPEPQSIDDETYSLNERQSMVHHIISNHLRDHLAHKNPPQRLMIVHGPGGTGKTTLLNAISKTFDSEGASHLLAKTAMSGVAASIVGGQTLHSWGALPITAPHTDRWITHPTRRIDARRKKNMQGLWLTVDEMSMLTTP